ncbi:hypothetical protein AQ824_04730 [Burkholderia pseudomallei]|nr:hypothetical protein AQ784_19170 [Burkholderia pseudomallei]OMV10865.1 hypothetical protein AQ785_21935 [Burkholderia pseudomallei]OMW51751.1 hypothetical protein AQ812_26635 [Burkholderia pseudomallei]OMW81297.1 hypothetical protein AQ816_23635 [Burkholderia pseudomallei]OMW88652.1 hypothetical protein AQ815_02535 [Burkholderia pseudomallei]
MSWQVLQPPLNPLTQRQHRPLRRVRRKITNACTRTAMVYAASARNWQSITGQQHRPLRSE